MDTMWEKIRRGLRDGASLSVEKIEEYTKIGKLKLDELAAKRKIERHLADIGQCVLDLLEEGRAAKIADSPLVRNAVTNVKALREELSRIEQRIREVQEEAKRVRTERKRTEEEVTGV
jgi:septation ring formation regulator EzrA